MKYPLTRDQWSVHFNISRDGKLFAGDGGAPNMVAHAEDGKWLYLFTPQPDGTLKAERDLTAKMKPEIEEALRINREHDAKMERSYGKKWMRW